MLNFSDMFFIKNIDFIYKSSVFFCGATLFALIFSAVKYGVKGAASKISLVLAGFAIFCFYLENIGRDVYVALDNPPFEVKEFISSTGCFVKQVDGKYYFVSGLVPKSFKSLDDMSERIESSYNIYVKEINSSKNRKEFKKEIEKMEKRGKSLNKLIN